MSKNVKLKKGYDIKILGKPQKETDPNFRSKTYAVKPTDFFGLSPIPKIEAEIGQDVKAGDVLFFDKKKPHIKHCAPVSGELIEVRRGEKRAIVELVILADTTNKYRSLPPINVNSAARDQIIEYMLDNGLWPFLRQRPFNIIAESDETPKAIFISGFDTTPLAADVNYMLQGQTEYFQAGVDVLRKLTPGKVHLSTEGIGSPCDTFKNVMGVEKHTFTGKHPAGNVGVQIHHIDPINKGDIVWTIKPQDVLVIGRAIKEGKFNTERYYSIGGPQVKVPKYVKGYLGANVAQLLKDNLKNDHVRVISGGVLSGTIIGKDGHIGFFDDSVSIIEEGDQYEFFGWLLPSYARPSASRTFPAFLRPNKEYDVNTNSHGEPRAFVVTGLYENVTPMDLYPMQLLKSILYQDFDQMEGLGIYEVVEEDLALCEFVCPSKTDFQEILRQGLDYVRIQG